jgi:hypothetical protein
MFEKKEVGRFIVSAPKARARVREIEAPRAISSLIRVAD